MSTHTDSHSAGGEQTPHAHVTSPLLLVSVFAGLILLTLITVGISYAESSQKIHLGPLSIWVAMFIAVLKAGLVAMFFMHLFWDAPFNGMVLVISLLFVAIFIGFAMLDTTQYHNQLTAPGSGRVVDLGQGR